MVEVIKFSRKVESLETEAQKETRLFTPTESEIVEHHPFNQIDMTNNGGEDLEVRPDGDENRAILVPAGVGKVDNSNAFEFLTVFNRHATDTSSASDMFCLVRKVIDK